MLESSEGSIRVEWRIGCPFLGLVMKVTAQEARRRNGEPSEALGYIYEQLRSRYLDGLILIDRDISLLVTIIRRKVSNFYRNERPLWARKDWAPLEAVDQSVPAHPRAKPPIRKLEPTVRKVEFGELGSAIAAAIEGLESRRAEAACSFLRVNDAPSPRELARHRGTSPQSIHQQARRAILELRGSLARYA